MKNILQRTLSALLCLVMIPSAAPAWSEATPSATLEIIQEADATPVPTEAPTPENETTAEPEITVEPAAPEASETPEASEEPQITAAPESTVEPEEESQVLTMEQALTQLSPEETTAPAAEAESYTYAIADGKATIIRYTGSEETLTIPEMLEDCPVTAIAEHAFAECSTIVEIQLPAGIEQIGNYAFYGCTALKRVTLPDSDAALSIGDYAFSGCSALEVLTLPYLAQIGENAFENCAALTLEIYAGSAADAYAAEYALNYIHREAIRPTAIIPESASITIGLNESVSLAGYTLQPAGAQAEVTYSSKKSSYASVNENGVVTGKRAGKNTTITLKTDNGEKCSVKVYVKKAPSSISLSAERSVIGVGEQLQLKVKLSSSSASRSITYVFSDDLLATVDANGILTAKAPGTVFITAATYNGKTTKKPLEIEIKAAPEYLTLSEAEYTLGKGGTFTLGYSLSENSAGTVSFASLDETIATVDANGKVKALTDTGSAVITATAHNGVSAACTVHAVPVPDEVIVSAQRKTIGVGEQIQLSTALSPEGTAATLKFSSSKTSVATVNASGVVTGKKAGSATITVTTHNGEKDTIKITVKKAPSSVKLIAERTQLGLGEELQLSYSLSSDSTGAVTYASLDETIACIDQNGRLTTVAPGTVTITATAYNGKKGSLDFTICPAPEFITFDAEEIRIARSDSYTIRPILSEGSAGAVTYSSSDESIATVSESGKITTNKDKKGSATITATTYNGKTAQCTVTVTSAPSSVSVSARRKTIGVGEQIQLSTALSPEDSASSLKFKSGKSSVASVNADGVVTGKKAGTATITVTTFNGEKDTIKITVKKAPSSVKLAAERTQLGLGEELQLSYSLTSGSAGAVSYSSSNETIARIDQNGLLTTVAPGTVTITATAYNGKTGSLDFTITPAPEFITLDAEAITIARGSSCTLHPTLSEGTAGAVSYSSSDEDIATVSASGKITANKENRGVAIITATTYNGKTAQCTVTVTRSPSEVSVSAPRKTLGVGEQIQLSTKLSPDDAAATLKFKSSKSSVASVNADGVVTAKKVGTATITVTTHNGKKDTIKITVKKAPSSVTAVAPRDSLSVGDTLQLNYKLSSGSAGSVSYASLTPEIADVTPSGVVTAIAPGTAQLVAVSHNGVTSDPCMVEILPMPTEILPDCTSFVIAEGLTATLSAQVNVGSVGLITYHSENPEIAKIDSETGKITAVSAGKTRVYASTYVEGLAGYADVEIKPAPSFVSLPFAKVTLGVGDTLLLNPEVDADALTNLKYSTKSSKIAKVSSDGRITAVDDGKTTITIKTHNGKSFTLTVTVKKAPKSISALVPQITLGVGNTHTIGYKITSDTAASVRFESLNSEIAAVDENGVITAKALGTAKIQLTTHNGKSCTVTVNVLPAPESISLSAKDALAVGMKDNAIIAVYPEDSAADVTFSVMTQADTAGTGLPVVQIDENGLVSALNPGTAVIRASTYAQDVYAEHSITVLPAPSFVSFSQEAYTLTTEETLLLSPMTDAGSLTTFTYTAKKNDFFTIDENGLISPIMRGTTTVTVTTHNGLTATVSITVYDPYYPEEMYLDETPPEYMESGDTYIPVIATVPATAVPAIIWSTSDAEIVEVDEITGELTAISYGQATIIGVSTRNPSLKISFKVTVLDQELCLTMPATRTDTSKINTTLTQIRAVRSCAYKELDNLYYKGVITKSDRDKRKASIQRAFEMHLFPWMTDTVELYWKAANSEDGAKDYKPGIVYYGLPYTQSNRKFNVDKAIDKGYFTKTSKNYYKMQGSKFNSRYYPGNDCSSFVSMSIHGMESEYSFLSTSGIAKSEAYRTLTNWEDLRPGDLLNKSGHVVMFLYYANEAKTQFVIIEQGGSASADRGIDNLAYSNTIACSIKTAEYYTSRGYKIRRPVGLGY